MVPPHTSKLVPRPGHEPYDIAVIGAGPVGLAIASQLLRIGFDVVVLDRRPPPDEDAKLRQQLLVARPNDLANLARLGIDLRDPYLVCPIAERFHDDLLNGDFQSTEVHPSDMFDGDPDAKPFASAYQGPVALVPIGRLQQALLAQLESSGGRVLYNCHVDRLIRHKRHTSIHVRDANPVMAKLAIIATGAARSLIDASELGPLPRPRRGTNGQCRQLIAGVFEATGDVGYWTRTEVPLAAYGETLRCTLLETGADTAAGSALLVDAPLRMQASHRQLQRYFDHAAMELGYDREQFRARPQVFPTATTALGQRIIAAGGRAPILIAGDAAQTGHVFTGLNCFVNLALALELCRLLKPARDALISGKLGALALREALARYQVMSLEGADVLFNVSQRHFESTTPGAWALS